MSKLAFEIRTSKMGRETVVERGGELRVYILLISEM